MKNYKRITIFENTRRIEKLIEFKENVLKYFSSVTPTTLPMGILELQENQTSLELRSKINLAIDEIRSIVLNANGLVSIQWTDAPAFGGKSQFIDLFLNIFHYSRFSIQPSMLFDVIDRAIGMYLSDQKQAKVRTINPLFWCNEFISWLISLPFQFLTSIGLNGERAEFSVAGKMMKIIAGFVIYLAAILQSLDIMGFKDAINQWRKIWLGW